MFLKTGEQRFWWQKTHRERESQTMKYSNDIYDNRCDYYYERAGTAHIYIVINKFQNKRNFETMSLSNRLCMTTHWYFQLFKIGGINLSLFYIFWKLILNKCFVWRTESFEIDFSIYYRFALRRMIVDKTIFGLFRRNWWL